MGNYFEKSVNLLKANGYTKTIPYDPSKDYKFIYQKLQEYYSNKPSLKIPQEFLVKALFYFDEEDVLQMINARMMGKGRVCDDVGICDCGYMYDIAVNYFNGEEDDWEDCKDEGDPFLSFLLEKPFTEKTVTIIPKLWIGSPEDGYKSDKEGNSTLMAENSIVVTAPTVMSLLNKEWFEKADKILDDIGIGMECIFYNNSGQETVLDKIDENTYHFNMTSRA